MLSNPGTVRASCALVTVLAAGALSACGARAGDVAVLPATSITFKATPQQRLAVAEAITIETGRCMHRRGFTWDVRRALLLDDPELRPYDAALARRMAAASSPAGLTRGASRARGIALFGDGHNQVVFATPGGGQGGTSVGGCNGEAIRAVIGPDVKRWVVASSVVSMLDGGVSQRVMAKPEYRAALARWRACVRRAGYPAPFANQRILAEGPTAGPPPVADAECGARARLEATGSRLEQQIRRTDQPERRNTAEVADYDRLVQAAATRVAVRGPSTTT
jgi:hypothetical protein